MCKVSNPRAVARSGRRRVRVGVQRATALYRLDCLLSLTAQPMLAGVQRAKPFAGARGVLASSLLPRRRREKREFATALFLIPPCLEYTTLLAYTNRVEIC